MGQGQGWRKLVKATADRRTRFHTLRGTTPRGQEWVDVVVSAARRGLRREATRPWLAPSAVRELDRLVAPHWRILEIGSGASTGWFADRCAHVESFESDLTWYQQVTSDLTTSGRQNAAVRHVPLGDLVSAVGQLPPQAYDLVLVDAGDEVESANGRPALVAVGRDKVRPGGYLVLDNSDRPQYRPVDDLMAGWPTRKYTGMPSTPLTVQETTFFQRPRS